MDTVGVEEMLIKQVWSCRHAAILWSSGYGLLSCGGCFYPLYLRIQVYPWLVFELPTGLNQLSIFRNLKVQAQKIGLRRARRFLAAHSTIVS